MEYKKNKKKFNLKIQKEIGEKLQDRKRKYEEDKKNPLVNKAVWNEKKRKWAYPFSQVGYSQPTVREIFSDLEGEPCDTSDFRSATKFAKRCMEKLENGEFDIEGNCSSKKYRVLGAGPPKKAIETRCVLFDVRSCLKGRLPLSILQCKAEQIYKNYCEFKIKAGEKPEELKINKAWIGPMV